ncbi:murein L,D-transpeptidase catalytic domain family protein [Robbsia sp. Bb-Pol-6]|uniref:Murein L,D-transpeptidase catalytic domain family protein n=1 Tax=Robbsia betulipollinis TaxID=2981849 RepID=A0ABT3ZMX5_9BURK|nr:murein L,D-transpeptidase catalytic domain family protein [Robbsia betulipollinis]MCY0387896.1 murein L,D-transpeptidase catalytic domain family protein [Robbsia betulipollinis]
MRLSYKEAATTFVVGTALGVGLIPMLQTATRAPVLRHGITPAEVLLQGKVAFPQGVPKLTTKPSAMRRFTIPTTMPKSLQVESGLSVSGVPVTVRNPDTQTLGERLESLAPEINPTALRLALRAMQCASKTYGDRERLIVIDYSLPSTARRLWAFNVKRPALLWNEYVLHGSGSGEGLYARSFSNVPDSNKSSLGLFELGQEFNGPFGPAMPLVGLEKGVNSNAVERGLWLHGTDYVNDQRAARGAVSTSEGCAAVQRGVIVPMINSLKSGAYLFSYYPDPKWLSSSGFLNGKLC